MYASRLMHYLGSFGVLPPSGEPSLSWFAMIQEYVIYYGAYTEFGFSNFMSYAVAIMIAPML